MNKKTNQLVDLRNKSVLNENAFEKETIDLINTSPPYNVGKDYGSKEEDNLTYQEYLDFSKTWLKNCYLWAKKTGRLCLNIPLDKNKNGKNSVYADITTIAKKVGWKYQTTIIWNEQNISKRTAWGSWMSATAPFVISPVEVIVVFYKEEWKRISSESSDISKWDFMEWTNGLWTFNGESSRKVGHPSPFPRELPKRCIKLFSFVGDAVLDPFAGSGTTLIEAVNHQRKALGLEVNDKYIKVSHERIRRECYYSPIEKFQLNYLHSIRGKKPTESFEKILKELEIDNWNAFHKNQTASRLIKNIWKKELVKSLPNSTRGTLLEYLIAYCLNSQGILPFYIQAKINLVDGVIYDIVLFNEKLSPIVLSIKTSLRERYKQAFLEARVLRDVYSSSKSYLLTLNGSEYKTRKREIRKEDSPILDDIIAADTEEFDKFLEELKNIEFRKSAKQQIITQGKLFE
jgi:site-specific DNA-methyltransferase (adenine-specific)